MLCASSVLRYLLTLKYLVDQMLLTYEKLIQLEESFSWKALYQSTQKQSLKAILSSHITSASLYELLMAPALSPYCHLP